MTNNTMTNPSSIERIVMRRVYTMRVLQVVFSNLTLALVVAVLALWGIGREVWVAKVFANGPQDFVGHLKYLSFALEHTRIAVQLLTATTLAAVIVFARETVRLVGATLPPRFV